jgi:hypothetical protein
LIVSHHIRCSHQYPHHFQPISFELEHENKHKIEDENEDEGEGDENEKS